MSVSRSLSSCVLAACMSACATSAQVALEAHPVSVQRPAREPGCAFEVFEEREPPRPYAELGTLAVTGNEYLGAQGRKELLQETACLMGADAVLLPRPLERKVAGGQRVREYEARFVAWTDVPARVASSDEPPPLHQRPPPTAQEGYLIIPVDPEWTGESVGTVEREVKPADGAKR
ncbi:hypothetical protein HUA76_09675 [Myxococcus sp. CA056]|uniref:hypothetical protein n=1 Tax=unclassified Myxococcus TaxID=2648731 RepID=UPI00157BA124|nr:MULTISPECIES: hypothetical protein [unclassified Myxococcus]NTX11054.1 hypothetical protein [Myxococcus sp. CA056]NTX50440.1 hypothetical protein [Myxococcus sp. CA039A]